MSPWIIKIMWFLTSAISYVLSRAAMEIMAERVERKRQAVKDLWRKRMDES